MENSANVPFIDIADNPDTKMSYHALPLEQKRIEAQKALDRFIGEHDKREPKWASISIIQILKHALENLFHYTFDSSEYEISWSSPWVELQYSVKWDWSNHSIIWETLCDAEIDTIDSLTANVGKVALELRKLTLFQLLTNSLVVTKTCGNFECIIPVSFADQIKELSPGDREAAIKKKAAPFTIGGTPHGDVLRVPIPYSKREVGIHPIPPIAVTIEDHHFQVSPVFQIKPLFVDYDQRQSYYPIVIGLIFYSEDSKCITPPKLTRNGQAVFWASILGDIEKYLSQEIRFPMSSWVCKDIPVKPAKQIPIVETFPVPRDIGEYGTGSNMIKGLSSMLCGYHDIPDLDIRGKIATKQASTVFWETFEKELNRQEIKWEKTEEETATIVRLIGKSLSEAEFIWKEVTRLLNKTEGGPGIQVTGPDYKRSSYLNKGEVIEETILHFWPTESLKDRWGWDTPPIRFRNDSSPGYKNILEQHGRNRYFANGWLWIPRGKIREGFQIANLSRLLFPEGKADLEQLFIQRKENLQDELNRIIQTQSLPQIDKTVIAGELRDAIRRVQTQLQELTVYDWFDTMKYILIAFGQQKFHWAEEKLCLPDATIISTRPFGRFIRIDAKNFRDHLDPKEEWGPHWRRQLMRHLEALLSFRRIVMRNEKRLDIGDQFIRRIIDPYSAPKGTEDRQFFDLLRNHKTVADNAFYVEISSSFISRFFPFNVSKEGHVLWGQEAIRAEEADTPQLVKTKRQGGKEQTSKRPRAPAYYPESSRLLIVSNIEKWSIGRKNLASCLLQELTPNFILKKTAKGRKKKEREKNHTGGSHQIKKFDGQDYYACHGSSGNGYTIQEWVKKIGYLESSGLAFHDDLEYFVRTFGLRLAIKNRPWTTSEGLQALSGGWKILHGIGKLILKPYLPTDMEKRLQNRLLDAGIEIISGQSIVTDPRTRVSVPEGITPEELRMARTKAKWTVQALANKLGVSKMAVSHWENGKKPIPRKRMTVIMELIRPFSGLK